MLIIWIILLLGLGWFGKCVTLAIDEEYGKAMLLFSLFAIFYIVYELFIKVT